MAFGLDEFILLGILVFVTGVPFFLGWRFVRAMERRNSASQDLHRLNEETRALREQAALLSSELSELAGQRTARALLERNTERSSHNGDSVAPELRP